MIPLARKKEPRTADLSRFTGKDIVQRYPAQLKRSAAFAVDCREYHVESKYAGQQLFVVLDRNGVYAVTDADGENIPFGPTPESINEA